MIRNKNKIQLFLIIILVSVFSVIEIQGQQDPQYTQYMYNTMSVNPAYAGSRKHSTFVLLGRTQWVGFDGAPDSQTLSYDTPIGFKGLGLGFTLINDNIGFSNEISLDSNVSYRIQIGLEGNLAFGLKLGGRLLNINWSSANIYDADDDLFESNIKNRFLPTVGAGVYYYEDNWYMGLSTPNFISENNYKQDNSLETITAERMHFFFIGGFVFDVKDNIKFKPAVLVKGVSGAPLSLDVSANFMFEEKFRVGAAWRWGDSIAALLGCQVSKSIYLGYSYDLTTSSYSSLNSGTHEIVLQYDIINQMGIRSPRFF